ncbi:metallophosphoesterase [Carnobacterium gallinarum]|uniref:metallophosphoesterase n=1 Tax=Carnobacterium gallinarum TaxID=2749 RepID=UPI00054D17BE|nr:metallophosphoesterase [Carnobacterium gallinarum]
MSWMYYVAIIAVLLIVGAIYLYTQNHWLELTRIQVTIPFLANGLKNKKIVHLSDLHIPRQNVPLEKLIDKVKQEEPDLIVLSGDLVDVRGEMPKLELALVAKELVAIAPTFAVTGNHDLKSGHLQEWESILTAAGVRVLIDEAEWLQLGSAGLVVMGLSEKEDFKALSAPILNGIQLNEGMQDQPKLLIAHRPEFFNQYYVDATKAPDIVFTGHAHGGQIRLPFIGGLYAPNQGRFPEYTSGVYYQAEMASKRMIVSRGIGNSTFPFRINNRPEIIVVSLN